MQTLASSVPFHGELLESIPMMPNRHLVAGRKEVNQTLAEEQKKKG